MKTTRIFKLGMLLTTILAFVLTSCTAPENGTASTTNSTHTTANHANEIYYWISQDSTLPLFVVHDQKALKQVSQELGVTTRIAGPTNVDLPSFISTIDQVCAQHPAGVIVVGWDPSESASVNKCVSQHVPTVTDDADLPNSNRMAFVGTNWYDIGVAQAKAMIQATGGSGQVAMLSIIDADNMKQAVQGFTDTLKGTQIKIVASEDDAGDAAQAASKTASLLAAFPNLAGIAGFDSQSGEGIVRALTEASKNGKIKVTAMEDTAAFLQNVKNGNVQAIIIQKRELFTYYALKLLYDFNHNNLHIAGLQSWDAYPIPLNIDTGLLVANNTNIDQIIKSESQQ